MPSSTLTDPFVITSLPRLPAVSGNSKICVISSISSPFASTFDIGVSGSYIGSFITRPTPKMIWSYALSPQSKVDCLDSYTVEETPENDELRLFAIGLTERKKSILKLITYGKLQGNENEEDERSTHDSVSVSNEEDRHTAEPESLKEVKTKDIVLEDELVGIKLSEDGKKVYCVSAKGTISILTFNVDEENTEDLVYSYKPTTSRKKTKILYHRFIKPEELQVAKSDEVESLLLTVETGSSNEYLSVKLFAIESSSVLGVSHSIIELSESANIDSIKLSYDPSGKLLVLENSSNLSLNVYSLPYTKKQKSIVSLGEVFKQEQEEQAVSIIPASLNRVLVSKGSTIALIDIQFEALLGSVDLYSKAKEILNGSAKGKDTANLKYPRTAELLACPVVKGNSLRSRETFALALLKNPKDNSSLLEYVSIDVGLGKLSDVLGRGLISSDVFSVKEFVGLPSLVSKPEFKSISKEVSSLENASHQLSNEAAKVYSQLQSLKKNGEIDHFEKLLVSYLKNTSMDELDEMGASQQGFKVYEVDQDRVVDPEFIKKTLLLLLDRDEKTNSLSLNGDFLPTNSLTYLLTHPLFPAEYTSGLLDTLQLSPRLMRQAIVTCPNVPCENLIEQLSHIEDEEVFKDIIDRLVEEFSSERVTKGIMKLMKKELSIDLDKIISKIIRLNYGYEILNSFIDSNGLVLSLHYSKNEAQLLKLINKAQSKVESLTTDTQLLTLVNQTLLLSEREQEQLKQQKKKQSKGKKKDAELNNGSIVEETSQLDSIISIHGKSSQLIKDEHVNKKIPVYSIEKLTI